MAWNGRFSTSRKVETTFLQVLEMQIKNLFASKNDNHQTIFIFETADLNKSLLQYLKTILSDFPIVRFISFPWIFFRIIS